MFAESVILRCSHGMGVGWGPELLEMDVGHVQSHLCNSLPHATRDLDARHLLSFPTLYHSHAASSTLKVLLR